VTDWRDDLEWLVHTFPPPEEVKPADWDEVEKRIQVALPSAYKALCDVFGDNIRGGKIDVLAPQSREKAFRFPDAALAEAAVLREMKSQQDPEYPSIPDYSQSRLFPYDKDGLLTWAFRASQPVFFQVDRDVDPDDWAIVVLSSRSRQPVPARQQDVVRFIKRLVLR